jgi:hypothetical protein
MSSDVRFVNTGAVANDGTGDAIRTAFTTVNSNFGNIDARISTGNFGVVYSGTYIQANLTLTSLGPTLTDTLEVYSTANIAGNAQIANLTVNNAFVASRITSTGNTYVQDSLNVTNDIQVTRNVVIGGNLTVLGNSVTVSSADLAIKDSLVNLHTVGLNPLTFDDGKDIGLQFHYYKTTDKHAALVWANDSQALEFYADGVESAGNTFSGTYGNVKVGSLFVTNTTATSDTTTGAIVSRGGIASAGNIAAANFLGNLYGTKANVGNLSVSGSVLGSLYFTGADTIYINGSAVATSAASFTGGTVPGYTLFNAVVESRGNIFANSQVASTGTTTGALVVNGGAGISGAVYAGSVNAPIGTGTVNTGAFSTVTTTGVLNASGNIVAGATTNSVGITTGALVVKGGVGIAGNLYVGGSINNTPIGVYGSSVGNFSSIGDQTPGSGTFTRLQVNNTTASTTLTSGAVIVAGGVGVSGNVYAHGLYANNIGFANGSPFVSTAIANTADITANIPSGASVGVSLTATGAVAGTYGNLTYYPIVTVDSKGRTTSISAQVINLPLNGTSGTGAANGSLTFAGTNGFTATVSGSTVTLSDPQDLRTTATPTFAGINVSGAIVPTANATVNLGSPTAWFNNIYGVSSQAKYADLAEKYTGDSDYAPGTVLVFGGTQEVTVATEFADTRVAGAVTTDPAYLMNAELDGVAIALRGRIPVNVIGKVTKGDLLVTSTTPGCAVSVGSDKSHGPAVFAKALNNKENDGIGQIEAVIL